MRRGDLVVVAAGGGYGGKPRPALIIQADEFDATDSLVLCLVTSDPPGGATLLRLPLPADTLNNLTRNSWLMIDKILALPKRRIGHAFGRLQPELLDRVDHALLVFLGLARHPAR